MAGKYYAVRKGFRTGIFHSWDECQSATKGFSGAEFKSFKNEKDATAYLNGTYIMDKSEVRVNLPTPTDHMVCIYTDGSYKDGVHALGVCMQLVGKTLGFCGILDGSEFGSSHNIFGELMAAMAGVQVAVNMGYREIFILYDNQGVESWYTGDWRANCDIARIYASVMRGLVTNHGLTLYFLHVKSHTGIEGNHLADVYAKRARNLGIAIDSDAILSGTLTLSDVQSF